LLGFAVDIALARGELDRARAAYTTTASLLARGKHRAQTSLPHARRAVELAHARGRAEEAAELAERALTLPELHVDSRYAWPLLLACLRAVPELTPRLRAEADKLDVWGVVQEAYALTFAATAAGGGGAGGEAGALGTRSRRWRGRWLERARREGGAGRGAGRRWVGGTGIWWWVCYCLRRQTTDDTFTDLVTGHPRRGT